MTNLESTAKAITDGEIILATIYIASEPDKTYRALITNEMETWWGEDGVYHISNWVADVSIGGKWTLDVVLPNGTVLPASGEFLELDPPNKFVITRRYDWDYPGLGRHATKVTYKVEPVAGGSRVTVRHEDFDGCAQAAYEHYPNWARLLNWLRDYLE